MNMIAIEDTRARLERHPDPDDCWLWCDLCNRFFQYKSAGPSALYPQDACPFDDCYGHGVGFHLLLWDDAREPDDPRWPSRTGELSHGMRSPDMEPFYRAQLEARIDALASAFARSPEAGDALGDEPPRYIRSFLQLASDLCWDLTDLNEAGFSGRLARELLADLPVWSQTAQPREATRMTAELRAFFGFAERTNAVADAKHWNRLVCEREIDAVFRHSMRTDWRLRAAWREGRMDGAAAG